MLLFVCAALLVLSSVQAQSLESRQGSAGLCFPGPNHKRNLATLDVTTPSKLEGEGLLTLVNVLKDTIRGVEKNENSIQMMLQNMAQIFSPEEKRDICDVQDCEGQNEKPTNPLERANPSPSDNSSPNDPKSPSDNPEPNVPSPSDNSNNPDPNVPSPSDNSNNPDPNVPSPSDNSNNPDPNDPTATVPPDNPNPTDETPTAPDDPLNPNGSGGGLQEETTTPPNKITPPLEDDNQTEPLSDIFLIVETKDKPEEDLNLQNEEILKPSSSEDISTVLTNRKLPKTDTEIINNAKDVKSPEDMFIIVETNDNKTNIINQTHHESKNNASNQEDEILNDQDDALIIVETDDKENQTEKSLLENMSIKNKSENELENKPEDTFVIVETGEKLSATKNEENVEEYLEQSESKVVTLKIKNVTEREKERNDGFVIIETDEKLNATRNETEPPNDDFIIVETDVKINSTRNETDEKLNAYRNETEKPKEDFIIVETDDKRNETKYFEVEQNDAKTVSITNDDIDPLNIIHQKNHDHRKIIKIPGKAYVIVETKDDKGTNKVVEERNTERKENMFRTLEGDNDKITPGFNGDENNRHLIEDKRDEKQKQLDLNILRLKYLQRRLEQPARLNKKLKIIRTVEDKGRLRNDEAELASRARQEGQGRAHDRVQYESDSNKLAYPLHLQGRLRNDEAELASRARQDGQGRAHDRVQYEIDSNKLAYPSHLQSELVKNLVPRKRHKIIRTKSIPEENGEQRTGIKKNNFNAPYRNGYSTVWQNLERRRRGNLM